MNRGHHMSYRYRTRNRKGGNDTVRSRLGLDCMMPLQCLSYKGSKGEGHRNKIHLGRFLYLQGCQAPQAGYTTLFARVDTHVHYCIATTPGGTCLLALGFVHVVPLLDPGGGCGCTDQFWPLQVSLC